MAKTEMTRAIEDALKTWHPGKIGDIKVNTFRGEHTALEVPVDCGTTTGGIVDAVRISEYFGDIERRRICRPAFWKKQGYSGSIECARGKDMEGKLDPYCNCLECRWNGVAEAGSQKILITCFEIKVSKSDFKSKHGHNFVGNMGYYAVPEEIYKEIEPLVPDGIGILSYLHKGRYVGLRAKKKPEYREMSDEDQKWLILSTLKRLRDMERLYYEKLLRDYRMEQIRSGNYG